jgi:hypothetical protein
VACGGGVGLRDGAVGDAAPAWVQGVLVARQELEGAHVDREC